MAPSATLRSRLLLFFRAVTEPSNWRPWTTYTQHRSIEFGRAPGIGHMPDTQPIWLGVRGCATGPLGPLWAAWASYSARLGLGSRDRHSLATNRRWRTHVTDGLALLCQCVGQRERLGPLQAQLLRLLVRHHRR
jgi:hypothetical protein